MDKFQLIILEQRLYTRVQIPLEELSVIVRKFYSVKRTYSNRYHYNLTNVSTRLHRLYTMLWAQANALSPTTTPNIRTFIRLVSTGQAFYAVFQEGSQYASPDIAT